MDDTPSQSILLNRRQKNHYHSCHFLSSSLTKFSVLFGHKPKEFPHKYRLSSSPLTSVKSAETTNYSKIANF